MEEDSPMSRPTKKTRRGARVVGLRLLALCTVAVCYLATFSETTRENSRQGKPPATAAVPAVKMAVERLPDLNIPRAGHSVFCTGGEVTVVGGHTSGFVLTPTAEYFRAVRLTFSTQRTLSLQRIYNYDTENT